MSASGETHDGQRARIVRPACGVRTDDTHRALRVLQRHVLASLPSFGRKPVDEHEHRVSPLVQARGELSALVLYRHELIAAARDDEHGLAGGPLRVKDAQLGRGDVGDERSRPRGWQAGGDESTVWW